MLIYKNLELLLSLLKYYSKIGKTFFIKLDILLKNCFLRRFYRYCRKKERLLPFDRFLYWGFWTYWRNWTFLPHRLGILQFFPKKIHNDNCLYLFFSLGIIIIKFIYFLSIVVSSVSSSSKLISGPFQYNVQKCEIQIPKKS